MSARSEELARALVRFNARVMGATGALLCGAGLFLATIALVIRGGDDPGPMLGLLRHFFPGYSVSVGGAFIGAFWAALLGYLAAAAFAWAYGPWFLRETTRAVVAHAKGEPDEPGHDIATFSTIPMALSTGALLAAGLFLATNWLWFRYGFPSPTLGLLSNYLPGYTTDFTGSLIGAFWIFLYGFVGAGAVAWIYNRIVTRRFSGVS